MTGDAHVPDGIVWDGQLDREPDDLDLDEPVGPEIVAESENLPTAEARAVAIRRLPVQFWDSREMFKRIRQAAWATQCHPDAVLAAFLCRAAGAMPKSLKFETGRGPSSMNLFACLLAGSGIGKSSASRCAERLMELPRHLQQDDVFKDGMGIGTGEGLAEIYMGFVFRETGGVTKKGTPAKERVRVQVRHNAYFYVDEGETMLKLMKERQGATLGPALRTAWAGDTLGQANARDETSRMVKGGTYSMGMVVGFQPDVAVDMLADVGPGTPQRFLWFGAQDTEMSMDETEWPGQIALPNFPARGIVSFPLELRLALRRHTVHKSNGTIVIDPLDSHEPLMRSKLSALLCVLDGRMDVTREDWRLAGMIWETSTAIRDTLVQFRTRKEAEKANRQRDAKIEETRAVAMVHLEISSDVERVAKVITRRVVKDGSVDRATYRKDIGRDKKLFDPALAHAKQMGWVQSDDDDRLLTPGKSRPI